MYTIIDEHAWSRDENYFAEIVLLDEKNREYLLKGSSGKKLEYCVLPISENMESSGNREFSGNSESYDSYEMTKDSEFADYFYIIERMLDELKGKIARTRYRILEKRTRMADNIYDKIPEGEIEIAFPNGESLFLFAYEAASYAEYGTCKLSWLDQNEEGCQIDREKHVLESYDSLQDSLRSPYAPLFLELYEMLQNAEDMPDEFFGDEDEWDEDGEPILPGFYQY
ncbi:MAG: hypothetical protein Q4E53_10270 [Eubacteriales bacterium]|nr:hypothetical protein [Eubacteriales bacterium]